MSGMDTGILMVIAISRMIIIHHIPIRRVVALFCFRDLPTVVPMGPCERLRVGDEISALFGKTAHSCSLKPHCQAYVAVENSVCSGLGSTLEN